VTSLTGIPLSEISLRIVVVEPLIDDVTGTNGRTIFRNVVKAMLPDAAGNVLYKEWAQDESVSVLESWKLENVYEPDQIRVVAFIQDEATKEIYQTAADSRGIVTGFNDPPDRNDHETLFTVYPNPAEDQVFIDLSRYNGEDILLELYNNLGSLVYSARVQAGTRIHELSVDALPDGMYLLRASSGQQILGNRKVIISK
jgi:hypothetical protein